MDRSVEIKGLPFDMNSHNRKVESAGTNVYLPDPGEGQVIKVNKNSVKYRDLAEALERVLKSRKTEEITMETAGPMTNISTQKRQ